jgi:hypothetical protein
VACNLGFFALGISDFLCLVLSLDEVCDWNENEPNLASMLEPKVRSFGILCREREESVDFNVFSLLLTWLFKFSWVRIFLGASSIISSLHRRHSSLTLIGCGFFVEVIGTRCLIIQISSEESGDTTKVDEFLCTS